MRISRTVMAGLLAAFVAGPALAGGEARYATPEAAFDQGLGAYKAGYYEIAIPALTEAAERGSDKDRFFARFYLARIYADNGGANTDHAQAYRLFDQIVAQSNDIEPDDGRRAPFVAKAMIALAGYLRAGVPQIGVAADPERATDLLQDAASIYNDKDAQFELAKQQLAPDAPNEDVKLGKHYLFVLINQGHPGAQAFLADLLWRGLHMPRDEQRAYALVKVALKHAAPQDRVWVEDIYQNIYCGASQGVRRQAEGMVAAWNKAFPKPAASVEEVAAVKVPPMERFCKTGEQVDLGEEAPPAAAQTFGPIQASPGPLATTRPAAGPGATPPPAGNGFGIVGAGVTK